MKFSAYQEAIFARVADPLSGSIVVQAVAGSGKTTTMVEALKHAPTGASTIFLAFNKAIATELASRGVNARTFHSVCYSPVMRATGVKGVEADKLRKLTDLWPRTVAQTYGADARKLVGLARNDGVGVLVQSTPMVFADLMAKHDIESQGTEEGLITRAMQLLDECRASPLIDFDDMLYKAVSDSVPLTRFDIVMVDEAQDTNAIQRAILRKILTPDTGRIIAVGDSAQAIYGFRGADSGAMDILAKEFNASRMPLTVTYRCATRIVEYASQWSPLEVAPDAPRGEVVERGDSWKLNMFNPNDLVVCRTNAPLIKLSYALMSAHTPVHVMGREIGAGLLTLVNKMQAQGLNRLIEKLSAWQDRELSKLEARGGSEAQMEAVKDKVASITTLIDSLPENARTVPELCRVLTSLFEGGPSGKVVLASIHKSKGLEAETVFWLNRSACPSKWAKQEWQVEQEMNLCYVAATRAKTMLVLIEMPK